MFRAVLLPPAKEDLRSAAKWYNSHLEGQGKRFTSEVRTCVWHIKQNPTACSIRYDQIRTYVLKKFPFVIHYYLDEKNNLIVITALLHTSLDPDKWLKRKR